MVPNKAWKIGIHYHALTWTLLWNVLWNSKMDTCHYFSTHPTSSTAPITEWLENGDKSFAYTFAFISVQYKVLYTSPSKMIVMKYVHSHLYIDSCWWFPCQNKMTEAMRPMANTGSIRESWNCSVVRVFFPFLPYNPSSAHSWWKFAQAENSPVFLFFSSISTEVYLFIYCSLIINLY